MQESRKRRVVVRKSLGPGAHLGVIELRSGSTYRVKLAGGGHVRAGLDADVDAAFADECMRRGRKVVVVDGARGPVIAGALSGSRRQEGSEEPLALRGRTIRLRADEELTVDVGEFQLKIDRTGAVLLKGRKLVLDAASLVRFLSARVELP